MRFIFLILPHTCCLNHVLIQVCTAGLLATRCIFQRLYSVKRSNPSSVNIAALMTMQCHKNVQLKCLQIAKFSNFLRKAPISFTSKRYINITSLLRMSKNYYDVLGVPSNANQKQIKDAYYKLAMKHHPDKNQGNLTQRFREIKEAYDVLSSESSRSKYNNSMYKNVFCNINILEFYWTNLFYCTLYYCP